MDLTREQILNEPAGSQMDDWVAEYVMEWILGNISTKNPSDPGLEVWRIGEGKDWKTQIWKSTWHPSTDIAAAWEVIEKMLQKGFSSEVISHYCSKGGDFGCHFWRIDSLYEGYTARANTAPFAICRAALPTILESDKQK